MAIGQVTQRGSQNNTTAGNFDYPFAQLHELAFGTAVPEFMQNVYKDYWQLYGNGFDLTTFLNCAGFRIDDWSSSRYTVFETPSLERAVQLADIGGGVGIAASAAGAAITFELADTEYDGNGWGINNTYRLIGTDVYIPKQYFAGALSSVPYRVTAASAPGEGVGDGVVFTAVPYAANNAPAGKAIVHGDGSSIVTPVPADEFLVVGPIRYGRGGGQPGGSRKRNLQRDFYLTMLAESAYFEGGANSFMPTLGKIDVAGNTYLWSQALAELEFKLERQKDKAIWKGYQNENVANNTSATSSGGANPVESNLGIRDIMEQRAQIMQYVGNFEMFDFRQIKEFKESQGDMGTASFFGVGPRLKDNIWENGLDFIQDYSRGSDLIQNMDTLGVNYKVFDAYGHKFVTSEMSTFVDRTSFGHPSQGFQNEGFVIPLEYASVSDDKGAPVSLPTLGIGYRKGNNENRESMMGVVAGVNGMGYPFVSQWDESAIHMKTELGWIALGVNKWVLVVE